MPVRFEEKMLKTQPDMPDLSSQRLACQTMSKALNILKATAQIDHDHNITSNAVYQMQLSEDLLWSKKT